MPPTDQWENEGQRTAAYLPDALDSRCCAGWLFWGKTRSRLGPPPRSAEGRMPKLPAAPKRAAFGEAPALPLPMRSRKNRLSRIRRLMPAWRGMSF
jgi:hypothetical protein